MNKKVLFFFRPNLTEVHTALIVYSLLECGLLSALVEVIITTDAILSVQAVILLGSKNFNSNFNFKKHIFCVAIFFFFFRIYFTSFTQVITS